MRAAVVERGVVEARENLDDALYRIASKMRIGDVALHAAHLQRAVQAAAPSDLDRLAETLGVGRLPDQAVIGALAFLLHPGEHLARAVDGRPLLVASDEQADRAVELAAPRLGVVDGRRGEAGDRPLHVGGAPAVEEAAGDLRGKRWMAPQLGIARRHDVAMSGEAKMRRAFADPGKEIVDRRRSLLGEGEALAGKACGLQRLDEHVERARVGRRHAGAADQALGERDCLVAEGAHSVRTFACICSCTADWGMAIFCQILRLRLVASISISLTASTTTGSSRSWA